MYGNNLPQLDVDTQFAQIHLAQNGSVTIGPNDWKTPNIKDWILRHEGLQKSIWGHTLAILALGDQNARNQYITLKRQDLNDIAKNVTNMFTMEYQRYINAGMPQHIARDKAKKFAEQYKLKMLETHNKQYPDDMSHEQVMKLFRIERSKDKKKHNKD